MSPQCPECGRRGMHDQYCHTAHQERLAKQAERERLATQVGGTSCSAEYELQVPAIATSEILDGQLRQQDLRDDHGRCGRVIRKGSEMS